MSVGTVSKQVCDGVTGPSVSWGVGGGERVFLGPLSPPHW